MHDKFKHLISALLYQCNSSVFFLGPLIVVDLDNEEEEDCVEALKQLEQIKGDGYHRFYQTTRKQIVFI